MMMEPGVAERGLARKEIKLMEHICLLPDRAAMRSESRGAQPAARRGIPTLS
jgi:hypothetical protein